MSILQGFPNYPATRVRVWRGDVLLYDALLPPSAWCDPGFDCNDPALRVERTAYDFRGEGSLRVLCPVPE